MKQKIFAASHAIWNWLVQSSADPTSVSLMVKGILVGVVPYLMTLLPAIGLHPSADLNSVPDMVYGLVFYGLTAVSAIMSFFGGARKVVLTFFPPKAQ